MKRTRLFLCTAVFMVWVSSCGTKELASASGGETDTQYEKTVSEETGRANKAKKAAEDQTEETPETETAAGEETKRMLVVNGELYVETDEEAPTPTCGTMDGSILSVVGEDETPTEEGQANFGNVGDGFQYADRDCLTVPFGEELERKWIRFQKADAGSQVTNEVPTEIGDVFEQEVNTLEGVSMAVLESSDVSAKVRISNETDKDIQFGDDYDLQKLVDGKWYSVPYKIDNWAFTAIAYPVAHGKPVEWEVSWEEFHGALPEGTYRIVKKVLDFRGTGDYTEYYLAAKL